VVVQVLTNGKVKINNEDSTWTISVRALNKSLRIVPKKSPSLRR